MASNDTAPSLIPGITGLAATPTSTPARASAASALRRRSGRGAIGSSILARSASIVVTVMFTRTRLRAATAASNSASRATRSDFVVIAS